MKKESSDAANGSSTNKQCRYYSEEQMLVLGHWGLLYGSSTCKVAILNPAIGKIQWVLMGPYLTYIITFAGGSVSYFVLLQHRFYRTTHSELPLTAQ